MNDKEQGTGTIGIFRVPRYKSEAGNKALEIFAKMKRKQKAEQVPPHSSPGSVEQVTPNQELQPTHE
jgi:hypothetical protein